MKLRKIETTNKVVQVLDLSRQELHYLYNHRNYIHRFIRLENLDSVDFELYITVDADTFEQWLIENNLINTITD